MNKGVLESLKICRENPKVAKGKDCFDWAIEVVGPPPERQGTLKLTKEDRDILDFIINYLSPKNNIITKKGQIDYNNYNNLLINDYGLSLKTIGDTYLPKDLEYKIPSYILYTSNKQIMFSKLAEYTPGAGTLLNAPGVKGLAPSIEYSYLGLYLFNGGS